MRQLARCLVCASTDSRLLYAATYRGGVPDAHRYFLARRQASAHGDIRRCRECGFAFTSPQFEAAEYDRIYREIGAAAAAPGGAPSGPGEAATTRRLRRLHDLTARAFDFTGRFLDFGCGDGSFLAVAGRAHGLGFEVGGDAERPGPAGSRILVGRWPEVAGSAALPAGSLAAVTAFDVFEHLPDLERDVELIRDVLRPDGHLFVTVPDIGSPMARLAGRHWNMLLLEHLWYFEASTLDAFLGRLGFRAVGHRRVPYDAALSHAVKRAGEARGLHVPRLPHWLAAVVVPVPAGVMFAQYVKAA